MDNKTKQKIIVDIADIKRRIDDILLLYGTELCKTIINSKIILDNYNVKNRIDSYVEYLEKDIIEHIESSKERFLDSLILNTLK